jgi:hypothetical protein
MGLVPTSSRLELLHPLGILFLFGVVDEMTSGVGCRWLDRARISLDTGGEGHTVPGEVTLDCFWKDESMLVLVGEMNASGVNRLMWFVTDAALTTFIDSYSDVVFMLEKEVPVASSSWIEDPNSKTTLQFSNDLGCKINIDISTLKAFFSSSKSPIGWEGGLIEASRMTTLMAGKGIWS